MNLSELLITARPTTARIWEECRPASSEDESNSGVLFMSACTAHERAHVVVARSKQFDHAWQRGAQQ